MNFIKSSYLSAISTAISLITKLIVNKIMAVFIGPSGFAIYGQFKDFVRLTTSLSQLGTENGVVKYTAETKDNITDFKSFISTIFKIHFASALLTALGIFIFKDWLNRLLFEGNNYGLYLIIIGFSLIFISFHNLLLAVLNGLKLLKKYMFISIITTLITALISIIAINYFHLNGLIISLAVNHFIVFVISISFLLKNKILKFSILNAHFEKEYLKKLSQFSLMSLSGIISLSLSLLFIRTLIIDNLGITFAGFWDSVWRISSLYILFLTSSFKFYILPTFSTLENNIQIKKEVLQIWKITLPTIIIITGGVFLFKDLIIRFLFTPEFLIIKSIILFQLLGDVIRIHSWTLGNLLIAKSKTRIFVTLQIIWGVIFSGLSVLLITPYGLKGITIAYFFTCVLHFIFLNISVKNILWKT
jgi:O-antigen/teichoic acid export membrane protein